MMESGSNVVQANGVKATEGLKAVGPTVYLCVKIGNVPVDAMVYTGAQSTIIPVHCFTKSDDI